MKSERGRFFCLKARKIAVCFTTNLFLCMEVYFLLQSYSLKICESKIIQNEMWGLILVYVCTFVITGIMVVILYIGSKNSLYSLCNSVLINCEEKDQFKRFEKIKECIETYKSEGICDAEKNAQVISAALKSDKSKDSFMFKIFSLEIITFILNLKISVIDNLLILQIVLIMDVIVEMVFWVNGMQRNAFIEEVVDVVKKENERKIPEKKIPRKKCKKKSL